jgi:hypothetical protein
MGEVALPRQHGSGDVVRWPDCCTTRRSGMDGGAPAAARAPAQAGATKAGVPW